MDEGDIAAATDTDVLWRALRDARVGHDHDLIRLIENRMRQLSVQRRFAHLSDIELEQQITALWRNRSPTGLLAHSPGEMSVAGSPGDGASTLSHNAAIRANQARVGVETTLVALMAERERRQAPLG